MQVVQLIMEVDFKDGVLQECSRQCISTMLSESQNGLSISNDNLEMTYKRENCMFKESVCEREREQWLNSNPDERIEMAMKIACIEFWEGHHGRCSTAGPFSPCLQVHYMLRVRSKCCNDKYT